MDAMKKRLDGMQDGMQDGSTLDGGAVTPVIRPMPLGRMLAEIDSTYGSVAAAKGLRWAVDPGCADLAVQSDPTLLGRVLRNLVENAIRHTQVGTVQVRCRCDGDRVILQVADTGPGIPPEHLERAWEEAHPVGNPERDRPQGPGLGLAIVRRLAHRLDHPVTVQSRIGQGSMFSVDLPVAPADSATRAPPAEPVRGRPGDDGPAPAGETAATAPLVLLVDDDAIVLLGLQATFEAWGYRVLAASTGDQGLEQLARAGRAPDLVVSDYRLRRGETGTQVVARIRAAMGPHIPALLLTGETGGELTAVAAGAGLSLVHKPVSPRQLAHAVQAILPKAA